MIINATHVPITNHSTMIALFKTINEVERPWREFRAELIPHTN